GRPACEGPDGRGGCPEGWPGAQAAGWGRDPGVAGRFPGACHFGGHPSLVRPARGTTAPSPEACLVGGKSELLLVNPLAGGEGVASLGSARFPTRSRSRGGRRWLSHSMRR